MSFSNERGHYGNRLRIGADTPSPTGRSVLPWTLGGIGLVVVGLAVLGARAAKQQQPRLTAHEKEVRAWQAEFPGLPWAMDEVKSSRQLDMWQRARDYWEKTH